MVVSTQTMSLASEAISIASSGKKGEVEMNRNKSFNWVGKIAMAVGALCLSVTLASAQSAMKGEFTLPFEIHWGRAILPAGQYSFDLESTHAPQMIRVRGEGVNVMLMAQATGDRPTPTDSALVLTRQGDSNFVRSLRLAPLGISLYFAQPKGQAATVAQVTQSVPVSTSSK
jgi:hypothetical protein